MPDPQDRDTQVEKPKLGITAPQVAGSALAAVSGAFFASWAGTTGTLIGAAFGSVIATIGSAIYSYSIRRSAQAVRRTAAQVRQANLAGISLPRTVSSGPDRRGDADLPEDATSVLPAQDAGDLSEEEDLPEHWWTGLPWARIAAAAAVVLVIAVGSITVFESLTGRTVSSFTGGGDKTGTTLGNVTGQDSKPRPSPKPSPTAPPTTPGPSTPASTGTTTPTPSEEPTPSPTDQPTSEPTGQPTGEPTGEPTGQSTPQPGGTVPSGAASPVR